jgi:hypothetical protein
MDIMRVTYTWLQLNSLNPKYAFAPLLQYGHIRIKKLAFSSRFSPFPDASIHRVTRDKIYLTLLYLVRLLAEKMKRKVGGGG